MKKGFIIGGVLLLLVIVAVLFYGYRYFQNNKPGNQSSQPAINSNESGIPMSANPSTAAKDADCEDTDGGKNIFQKGTASTQSGKAMLHKHMDLCATYMPDSPLPSKYLEGIESCEGESCYVSEGYCTDNKVDAREFIQCKGGCQNGACKEN